MKHAAHTSFCRPCRSGKIVFKEEAVISKELTDCMHTGTLFNSQKIVPIDILTTLEWKINAVIIRLLVVFFCMRERGLCISRRQ